MSNRPYDARYEPRPGEQGREEELRYQRFLGALQRAGIGSAARAERAAVTVLCALERRIGGTEAREVNEELPWALRDLLRRCEIHPRSRPEPLGREDLLARIAEELGADVVRAEQIARTVLLTARRLLSEKEASDVAARLPRDLQDLWAPPA